VRGIGTKGKRVLRYISGYACIAAGIAGCILPVIPGIPLLFVGLGILSVDSPWAARLLKKLKSNASRLAGKQPASRAKPESEAASMD